MRLLNEFYWLIKKSFKIWSEKNPYLIGGSIAFYVIFSIAPLFAMIIILSGLVFGQNAAEGQIVKEIKTLIGVQSAQMVQDIIKQASSPPSQLVTTIISIPMVILGSSMVFYQIRQALNFFWELEDKHKGGIAETAKDYFFSFMMVLIVGVLVLLLVIKMPILILLKDYLSEILFISYKLLSILDAIVTFLILTLLFALIFKILPQIDIEWRDVWVGSFVTSFLFTAAVLLINLYVGSTGVDSAYGAIGAGTVLLIWIYYSSLVFLLGAAFTKVYASSYGSQKIWEKEINE